MTDQRGNLPAGFVAKLPGDAPLTVHFRTADPIKAALLRMMIDAARLLTEEGEINVEYVRGQAELICDVLGLSMDENKDGIMRAIGERTPVHITRYG
jgi:hypothetical protein